MGDAFSDSSYCGFCGRKTGCYVGAYGQYCGQTCYDLVKLKTGKLTAELRPEKGTPNDWAVVQRWVHERYGKKTDCERVVNRYVSEEVAKLAIKEARP